MDGDGWGRNSGGGIDCPNGSALDCDDVGSNITDRDGDHVCDPYDNCPESYNPEQVDSDGDGRGDGCDNCDLYNPGQHDCQENAVGDVCDIADGSSLDCQANGAPDECEVPPMAPSAPDCNANGIPDECEPDCQSNGIPDDCDLASRTSEDCQGDRTPDECQLVDNDCNENRNPDDCDVDLHPAHDCQQDQVPDNCQLVGNDCNGNHLPDDCERDRPRDLNGDGTVDNADYAMFFDCLSAPDLTGPHPGCTPEIFAAANFDGDGLAGLFDFAWLQARFGVLLNAPDLVVVIDNVRRPERRQLTVDFTVKNQGGAMPFLVEVANGSMGLRHLFEAAFQVRLQCSA